MRCRPLRDWPARDRLEGDHDVVRGSEFESVGAQPVLSLRVSVALSVTSRNIGTTTLYSNLTDKRIVLPSPYRFVAKYSVLRKIALIPHCKVFIIRDLRFRGDERSDSRLPVRIVGWSGGLSSSC